MDFVTILAAVTAAVLAGYALGRRPRPAGPAGVDPQLGAELRRLTELVAATARDRAESHGLLSAQIRAAGEQTARLAETTGALREALASAKARGQWGERMAEDVLRAAGFVEGVSYVRQTALPDGGVPDYTFLLPRGMALHMDVKFPLDNYLRVLRAEHDAEREAARVQFLRDVRTCIRGLAARGYADPATAVDTVLLFIPNEQLFAFVQEHDPALLDEALAHKVVCCSPLTLFAVLAVVRQAAEQFRLERTSDEALALLGRFGAQWEKFTGELERLGRQLDTARRTYDEIAGPRRRQLERPLDRIDALRRERGLDAEALTPSEGSVQDPGANRNGGEEGYASLGASSSSFFA
jgi:DNA recombination protein RmuC